MSAVRIPIPRPLETDTAPRGGVDDEDMRRTRERAEAYADAQRSENAAALAVVDAQRHAALVAADEARFARTISARAATVRSEATRNLVLGVSAGVLGVLLLGPIFFPRKDHSCSPSRR